VATVADRICWIVQADPELTEGALSLRAGLERSHVSTYLRKAEKTGDDGGINLKTLRAIANAGNVRLAWLVTGEGAPEDVATARSSPEAEAERRRKLAGELALEAQVDRHAVASVLGGRIQPDDVDKPTLWWLHAIEAEAEDQRRGAAMIEPSPPHHPRELQPVKRVERAPPSEPEPTPRTQTGTVRRTEVEAHGAKHESGVVSRKDPAALKKHAGVTSSHATKKPTRK
jgi:hypothetical protein